MRRALIFIRLVMGWPAPFCLRWGHDRVRGFGPGRESGPTAICLDPECGWYEP